MQFFTIDIDPPVSLCSSILINSQNIEQQPNSAKSFEAQKVWGQVRGLIVERCADFEPILLAVTIKVKVVFVFLSPA